MPLSTTPLQASHKERTLMLRGKWNEKWEHTPEGWEEMVNADWGAQCIWERADPLMLKRVSTGSDPTARI